MTASVTNKTLNTGSMTNKTMSGSTRRWIDILTTWAGTFGPWSNPYSISNKALNTGTMTNRTLT